MSVDPHPESEQQQQQLLYYIIAVLHQRPHWIPTIREYIENDLSKSTGKEQSMTEPHPVPPPEKLLVVTESPPNNIWDYLRKRFSSRKSK